MPSINIHVVIVGWSSVDTWSTVGHYSVECWVTQMHHLEVSWLLTAVNWDVDGVSIQCELMCWWSVNQVSIECHSRVEQGLSINTQLWMPFISTKIISSLFRMSKFKTDLFMKLIQLYYSAQKQGGVAILERGNRYVYYLVSWIIINVVIGLWWFLKKSWNGPTIFNRFIAFQ